MFVIFSNSVMSQSDLRLGCRHMMIVTPSAFWRISNNTERTESPEIYSLELMNSESYMLELMDRINFIHYYWNI